MKRKRQKTNFRSGIAFIAALIFLVIFSALSVGMLGLSTGNAQVARNHQQGNGALNAALSGLECARYVAQTTPTISTNINSVTEAQATEMWGKLCDRLVNVNLGNQTVNDPGETGTEISTPYIPCQSGGTFQIRFYRTADHTVIGIETIGNENGIERKLRMPLKITKDAKVMNYAIAGRGRMWLTGDTTIHGSIYSSWNRASISPFNMTDDSRVEGTINTVLTKAQIDAQTYQLETLDAAGNPMFDADGNRIYSSIDEIQGYHEGINYGQPDQSNIPGMNINDYNTSMYKNNIPSTTATTSGSLVSNGSIPSAPTSSRVTEYFPHAAGSYTTRASSSSLTLTRHKYENKTFRNVVLPSNRNALFKNCNFEEVLYVDCATSGSSYYNNVRFENCTFNGTIITNVPASLSSGWWQKNCLYFTGAATFQNNSSIPEATILAPHFNVNLGNTNPNEGDNNILTGAIVGGIVDIRGNAEIYGTIISMADTTAYTSGYVTNIGATLEDGGSETTEAGDIGTIEITPDPENMLPSGITTPVILKPQTQSYEECR